MKKFPLLFLLAFCLSCAKDELPTQDPVVDNDITDVIEDEPLEVPLDACDPLLRPIVVAHGFLASGDTYALQFQRFESLGYCPENLFAYDWNSLDQAGDPVIALDALIDNIIASTSFTQVDLAGHSAGSGLGYTYLEEPSRAAKVANYAHLAGSPMAGPAGTFQEVPTLNIWSTADLVVAGGSIPGATNVMQTDQDHYQVATGADSFIEMYEFFNGVAPANADIIAEADIDLSGRVVSFGENIPVADALVNIFEVDPSTGFRVNSSPDFVATADADGNFGPVAALSCVSYEFEVIGNAGDRILHYYREPFIRSDQLVYLRTIPSSGLASLLLGSLPSDDNQTVLAFYSGSQAVISGRDSLTVDDTFLATPDFTAAANSIIAMFFYDDNNNQVSDVTQIGGTWAFLNTFLKAIDFYFPTQNSTSIPLQLNGRTINVPNLQSATEGVAIAQFN